MTTNLAREIIFAIGDNMREGLEPLITKTLAPSLYQVYLHADDFDRVRSILPQIEAEAKEHLNRLLAELSSKPPSTVSRVRDQVRQRLPSPLSPKALKAASPTDPMTYEPAAGDWSIRFQEDPNDQLDPGDIEVISELAVGNVAAYGAGSKTQRISVSTTRKLGKSESRRLGQPAPTSALPASPNGAWAYFHFQDDDGPQRFAMTAEEITIGRHSSHDSADISLATKPDVSRKHVRVRRHTSTGGFWIEDLSQYGTQVNGRALPQGVEVELPDAATISLASIITLTFEKSRA